MEFGAQFVHRSDQRSDIFRICVLWNAVAEIEYMAGSAPKRRERLLDLAPDDFRRSEQHHRIEISLECRASADSPARIAKICAPVDANAIASACGNALQPGRAALGEDDDRDAAAALTAVELG